MKLNIKRAYESAGPRDGKRVLVDRLWPRGVKKEEARIDMWLKNAAPSNELRKWFGHDLEKWDEFKERYWEELDAKDGDVQAALKDIADRAKQKTVTLVFGAKDEQHNNAAALKEYLEDKF